MQEEPNIIQYIYTYKSRCTNNFALKILNKYKFLYKKKNNNMRLLYNAE